MQSEASVEIERAFRLSRPGDRDAGAHRIVVLIRVRNNDVQAVDGAAQEDDHQSLLPGVRILDRPAARAEGTQRESARCSGICQKVAAPHAESPLNSP